MEHHWILAQKELDQEKALHTKLQVETQKDHEDVIKEGKSKLERTSHENENRLADIKKAHTEQCEELSREALKAKLEADRLYNELIARGVDVPRHMLFSDKDNSTKKVNPVLTLFLFLLAISSIVSSLTWFELLLKYHLSLLRNTKHIGNTYTHICTPIECLFNLNTTGICQARICFQRRIHKKWLLCTSHPRNDLG